MSTRRVEADFNRADEQGRYWLNDVTGRQGELVSLSDGEMEIEAVLEWDAIHSAWVAQPIRKVEA